MKINVKDCPCHYWVVGASFGDDGVEYGIFVHCSRCGCMRTAKFNKECDYRKKSRRKK